MCPNEISSYQVVKDLHEPSLGGAGVVTAVKQQFWHHHYTRFSVSCAGFLFLRFFFHSSDLMSEEDRSLTAVMRVPQRLRQLDTVSVQVANPWVMIYGLDLVGAPVAEMVRD